MTGDSLMPKLPMTWKQCDIDEERGGVLHAAQHKTVITFPTPYFCLRLHGNF